MKIKVEFTLDVPVGHLAALRELALAENNADAALFVRGEASDLIRGYLEDMGVRAVVVRETLGQAG